MIYTNEANFRLETKWHSTVPWATSLCHIIWAHTLLSGDRSPILRDASNRLLNTHKFPKIHSVMMKTMEVRESFRRSMKKWNIRFDSIVYLWFRTLEVVLFPHNTTARESWIKVTILVGGRCQAISNKSKYQIRAFPLCFPDIPHFFAGSVFLQTLLTSSESYGCLSCGVSGCRMRILYGISHTFSSPPAHTPPCDGSTGMCLRTALRTAHMRVTFRACASSWCGLLGSTCTENPCRILHTWIHWPAQREKFH